MKEFKPIRMKKNGEPDNRFKNAKQLATNINARKDLDRKLSEAKLVKERDYAKEKSLKWLRFLHLVQLLLAVGLLWLAVALWGYLYFTYKNVVYVNPEPHRPIIESCMGDTCIDKDNNQTTWIFNVAEAKEPLSIEDKIRAYDWDDGLMLAIARFESSGYACELRPNAINDQYNSDGSADYGLFQINSVHGYDPRDLMDEDFNIEVAYKIWKSSGYTAWVAYNNGMYQSCGGAN